jgi:D-galactarolactone cycloisomerase
MKIKKISGYDVCCKLPELQGNSTGYFDTRSSLVVAVTLDNGITGWGETWQSSAAAGGFVQLVLAPSLIGQNSEAPQRVWRGMMDKVGYDRRGASVMALSALDMAIWDAAARSAGAPLSLLLGGALRERVRPYASGPFLKPGGDPYRDFLGEIEGYLRHGFTAVKMRMGTNPDADGVAARRVRELVGPDVALMADLNEGFTVKAAERIAHAIGESDLIWLEEPILPDDLQGYHRLAAAALPMALAGGEALCGLGAFRDFLAAGVLDIVQPDLAICGGFSEGLRIAALADAFDVPVVPHVWGTGINFYASLQFTAVLPTKRGAGVDYPLFEYDFSPNPLRSAFGEIAVGSDGMIAIPNGPGIGVEIRRETFSDYIINEWQVG